MLYDLEWLLKHAQENQAFILWRRAPARPLSGPWTWRVKAAWGVLTGKYDAIRWPLGQ